METDYTECLKVEGSKRDDSSSLEMLFSESLYQCLI
jgi:hypothetical protein